MVFRLFRKFVGSKDQAPPERPERCHTCKVALAEVVAGQHTVLRCPTCQGSWLTSACLGQALCDKQEDKELLEVFEGDGQAEIGHTFAPSRVLRACPCCEQPMENHKFEDSGVWLDTCSQGHGIWLDRGELGLLASRRKNRPADEAPDLEDRFEDVVSDLLLGYL